MIKPEKALSAPMSKFIQELQGIIAEKHLLNHPFYQAWSKGQLPMNVMREYAKQYYHLEKNFPMFLSKMHAACADTFDVRQIIAQNLFDEEVGAENHRELWLRYCEGIGVPREEVEASSMIDETRESVAVFNKLANDYVTGSAALAAYESQIPAVAKSKMAGLAAHYGVEDEHATKFFRVHSVVDVRHADAWWDVIEKHADTDETQQQVREAVAKGRDALWRFLDGIMRVYMPQHVC